MHAMGVPQSLGSRDLSLALLNPPAHTFPLPKRAAQAPAIILMFQPTRRKRRRAWHGPFPRDIVQGAGGDGRAHTWHVLGLGFHHCRPPGTSSGCGSRGIIYCYYYNNGHCMELRSYCQCFMRKAACSQWLSLADSHCVVTPRCREASSWTPPAQLPCALVSPCYCGREG